MSKCLLQYNLFKPQKNLRALVKLLIYSDFQNNEHIIYLKIFRHFALKSQQTLLLHIDQVDELSTLIHPPTL